VKQAVGVVRAYVTAVQAAVTDAEDGRDAAVEVLRGTTAEVRVPSWDKISDGLPPPGDSSDPDGTLLKESLGGPPAERFKSQLEGAHEHVSRVSDAMKKADGAANSALAVVALAERRAMTVSRR